MEFTLKDQNKSKFVYYCSLMIKSVSIILLLNYLNCFDFSFIFGKEQNCSLVQFEMIFATLTCRKSHILSSSMKYANILLCRLRNRDKEKINIWIFFLWILQFQEVAETLINFPVFFRILLPCTKRSIKNRTK